MHILFNMIKIKMHPLYLQKYFLFLSSACPLSLCIIIRAQITYEVLYFDLRPLF